VTDRQRHRQTEHTTEKCVETDGIACAAIVIIIMIKFIKRRNVLKCKGVDSA